MAGAFANCAFCGAQLAPRGYLAFPPLLRHCGTALITRADKRGIVSSPRSSTVMRQSILPLVVFSAWRKLPTRTILTQFAFAPATRIAAAFIGALAARAITIAPISKAAAVRTIAPRFCGSLNAVQCYYVFCTPLNHLCKLHHRRGGCNFG